jgi:hypothetical protein
MILPNYQRLFIAILLITGSASAYGQSLKLKELPISVAYYGDNGIHPGLKIGTTYNFLSKTKYKAYRSTQKQGKYGDKGKRRDLFADLNLGFYSFPNNHTGVFSNVGLTYLRTKLRKNWQLGASLELGFLGRINKFETYALDPDGSYWSVPLAGNRAAMLSLAPVFGKEFQMGNGPVRVYMKPIFQLMQYTHTWQPNASLEIGMVFKIHHKGEDQQ